MNLAQLKKKGLIKLSRLLVSGVALLFLAGCYPGDRFIRRLPEPVIREHRKISPNSSFERSSFNHIAQSIRKNGRPKLSTMKRSGLVTFSGRTYAKKCHFTYHSKDQANWQLKIFDRKKFLLISLTMSGTGLTYRNILREEFIQSDATVIWKKLETVDWLSRIKDFIVLLEPLSFDPNLDWSMDDEGFKSHIFSVIEQAPRPIKRTIYIHKKNHVITKVIRQSKIEDTHVVTDYSKFREIDDAYIPMKVASYIYRHREKISIYFNQTSFEAQSTKGRTFQKL